MTISQALKFASAKLGSAKILLPHLEAEILLSNILKKPREFLLAHGEIKLLEPQINKYKQMLKKRLKGVPVAYLIGHKEFFGLNFEVNKNVLIPRPETELIVDEAIKIISGNAPSGTIIDVGTGSGCIIIALAKLLSRKSKIINYKLWGIDISRSALSIAHKNAKIHGLNKSIKFIKGDLLTPLINNSKFKIQNSKLIIVANLPYGWKAWKNNYSQDTVGLKFEPKKALFTGKNGLELYEKLFQQINRLIAGKKHETQKTLFALCEIDPRQTKKIKQLIKQYLPEAKLQIKKDLAGLDRLLIIMI